VFGGSNNCKTEGGRIMLEVFIAAGIAFGILGIYFYKVLTKDKKI